MAQAPKPTRVRCIPVRPSRVVGREVITVIFLMSLVVMGWSASGGGGAQGGAERGDDGSADGDREERPGEAGLEELVPQPGQDEQLAGDHGDRRADGGAVAGDEEREGVEDAAGEGPASGD